MSQAAPPVQDAPAPFSGTLDPDDNFPPSNLILRAGDGVDLHARKEILTYVSVFFHNLFSGAEGQTDLQRDGKPVILLPESSDILYRLLCVAYPRRGSLIHHHSLTAQTLDGVWAVHEAAQKYLFVGAKEVLEIMLEDPRLLDAHPHRMFAIAQLRDLPELARKAALRTLNSPVSPNVLDFPELELIPASGLQKLYNFHHHCGEEAHRIASDHAASIEPIDVNNYDVVNPYITRNLDVNDVFVWWKQQAGFHSADCGGGYHTYIEEAESIDCHAAKWFQKHCDRVAAKVRAIPTRTTVEREVMNIAPAERAIVDGCDSCSQHATRDLRNFASQLAVRIDTANQQLAQEL